FMRMLFVQVAYYCGVMRTMPANQNLWAVRLAPWSLTVMAEGEWELCPCPSIDPMTRCFYPPTPSPYGHTPICQIHAERGERVHLATPKPNGAHTTKDRRTFAECVVSLCAGRLTIS
ncbi:MAG UNVERIFIED_CONTAM: hypothetical protein LVT10_07230, partial [Anaerolineae bacterium]